MPAIPPRGPDRPTARGRAPSRPEPRRAPEAAPARRRKCQGPADPVRNGRPIACSRTDRSCFGPPAAYPYRTRVFGILDDMDDEEHEGRRQDDTGKDHDAMRRDTCSPIRASGLVRASNRDRRESVRPGTDGCAGGTGRRVLFESIGAMTSTASHLLKSHGCSVRFSRLRRPDPKTGGGFSKAGRVLEDHRFLPSLDVKGTSAPRPPQMDASRVMKGSGLGDARRRAGFCRTPGPVRGDSTCAVGGGSPGPQGSCQAVAGCALHARQLAPRRRSPGPAQGSAFACHPHGAVPAQTHLGTSMPSGGGHGIKALLTRFRCQTCIYCIVCFLSDW